MDENLKAIRDAYLGMYKSEDGDAAPEENLSEEYGPRDVADSLAAVADYLVDALERNSDDVTDVVYRQAERRRIDDDDAAEMLEEVFNVVIGMLRDVNKNPQRYLRSFG